MQTYSPLNVNVVVGTILIDQFGPDSMIKVARNQDGWTYQPSNSGRGARSRNPDKSGRLEITVLASAPCNGLLSALALLDEKTGQGVGGIMVKDRSTAQAKCAGQNSWVVKWPDWERAKEVGTVTWILECDELEIFHDGVTQVTTTV